MAAKVLLDEAVRCGDLESNGLDTDERIDRPPRQVTLERPEAESAEAWTVIKKREMEI